MVDQGVDSIYEIINKFLSEGYAVVYATEGEDVNNISKSQFVNFAYSKMKQSQLIEDVEHHIQTKALKIVDVREIYPLDQFSNTKVLLKRWTPIIKELRRMGNFKNIAIISDGTRGLPDNNNQNKLVDIEQLISEAATKIGSVHVVCCYLQDSLDKMQFAQLASIINAHQCNAIPLDISIEYRKIDSSIMLDAIEDGIEEVLGEGSARLIIKTMKMVYKIDKETIVSNPSLFQEKLEKILGSTSKKVLDSASKKIIEILLGATLIVSLPAIFASQQLL